MRLGDQFDVREGLRFFQSLDELEFGVVAGRANHEFYFDAAFFLLWLDADDANAGGKNFLEVHEHHGPVKAARVDKTVNERSAVMQPGIFVEREKVLEGGALPLKVGDLAIDAC